MYYTQLKLIQELVALPEIDILINYKKTRFTTKYLFYTHFAFLETETKYNKGRMTSSISLALIWENPKAIVSQTGDGFK